MKQVTFQKTLAPGLPPDRSDIVRSEYYTHPFDCGPPCRKGSSQFQRIYQFTLFCERTRLLHL